MCSSTDSTNIGGLTWQYPKKPFDMSAGGVIRIMVDFANIGQSTIISPPGQSGHYRSPYYDDLVDMWARGDQVPMNFGTSDQLRQTLTLVPRS
jgi:penicillin amidase